MPYEHSRSRMYESDLMVDADGTYRTCRAGFREQAPALERVLGAGVVRPLVTVKGQSVATTATAALLQGRKWRSPWCWRIPNVAIIMPLWTHNSGPPSCPSPAAPSGPEQVIDVLSQQAALLLTVQNQLVEKPGLTIADNLREASQVGRQQGCVVVKATQEGLAASRRLEALLVLVVCMTDPHGRRPRHHRACEGGAQQHEQLDSQPARPATAPTERGRPA